MTIAAVYRIDDRAIFISDFRNTHNKNQTDVSLKFINIGEKMGLFLSGDALFWQRIIPLLEQCITSVTIDNVISNEGILYETISNAFWHQQPVIKTRAIGFVIDDSNKTNILFYIDLVPGIGVQILPIGENSCCVIGSGSLIPHIEDRLSKRVNNDIKTFGNDNLNLYRLADGMRREVQNALVAIGSSSFKKLGISPYMALHSLAGSHFIIRGEEIEGETFSQYEHISYHYSFFNDKNEIILVDHINNKRLVVNNIINLQDALAGDQFDPEHITDGLNIEQNFKDKDFVYVFHQWVSQEDNQIIVYRSIRRIDFVELTKEIRIEVSTDPVVNLEKFPIEHHYLFPDCRDQFFFVKNDEDDIFMAELDKNKLFNNNWLSSYIDNYYSTFYLKS